MSTADTLTAWGILRAPEVVELAAQAGLDLAAAAVCLEKESYGGKNVWGSDPVDTGGIYRKGDPVTREAYERYAAALLARRVGAQGVGPTQLTYPPLQRQADAAGGCWDWRTNVLVGFRHLAQLQRQYGVRDGFRRYNGSGPAAEKYANDAMSKLARWRDRIGTTATVAAPTTTPPAPLEDDLVQCFDWPAGTSHRKLVCPVGKASQITDRAWFSVACDGEAVYDLWFQGDGVGIDEAHGRIPSGSRHWWELPDGTTQITFHYTATGAVGAALELLPK